MRVENAKADTPDTASADHLRNFAHALGETALTHTKAEGTVRRANHVRGDRELQRPLVLIPY